MHTPTETAVTALQKKHRTVRYFKPDPIDDAVLTEILAAGRRAPTSSNMQTYSIMVVKDPETKKKLAVLAGNQKHIEVCPVFLAFCADIRRLELAGEMHGQPLVKGLETTLVSTVDAALVGMSVNTAVESFGLGAVMIGAMRNHPKQVAELLGFPSGVYVVYGMCIGEPIWGDVPPQKPRMSDALIIHHEQYRDEGAVDEIAAYDRALANYYGSQSRNQHDAAWSGPIANRLNQRRRPHLRQELEELGFRFD